MLEQPLLDARSVQAANGLARGVEGGELTRFRGHSIVRARAPEEVRDGTETSTLPAGVPGGGRSSGLRRGRMFSGESFRAFCLPRL